MPDSRRLRKISQFIREEISNLILNGIKDPRVEGIVTVLDVDVSPDLSNARVIVSVYGVDDKDKVVKGLRSASGFIKGELSKSMRIRRIPDIDFVLSDSIDRGMEVYDKFKEMEELEGFESESE